jgi:glycosyltransferase involved in cell wall biosynthesis
MTDGSSRPFVSVIVPAFDNAAGLELCLRALEDQTYPADRCEVIVVDNGSRVDPAPLVSRFSRARLERESQPGSYAARNRGLAVARGEILAFTDSDCVPAHDWIKQGVASLAGCQGCGFAAGQVDLSFRDPAHPSAAELYDFLVMNFHQEHNVRDRKFGATANLFVPKPVFDRVGMFDATLLSGGDLEWGERVLAKGLRQTYAAEARVAHPARYSLDETYRRALRLTGGDFRRSSSSGAGRRAVELARAFTPAVPFYARVLSDHRLPRFGDRVRVVLVALGVKYVTAVEHLRLTLGGSPRRG